MQVSNTTPQGAHYTITAGGPGAPITPPPGTIISGFLRPGAEKELKVRGAGPWKVSFVPEGGGDRVQVVASSPTECVQLCERSGMLRAEIAVLVPSATE